MTDPKKPSLVDRIRGSLRISLAAWLAIGVGVSLIAITVFSWIIFLAEPQRVAWGDYLQWPQLAVLFLLWLSTCAATYWTVRLWTEDVPIREFDLEEAWQAGIEALRRRGQSIRDLPLFLVLGAQQEQSIHEFVRFSQLPMSTEPVPPHPQSPLRWIISDDRVLLFCRDAGTFAASQRRMSLYRQQEVDARQDRRSRGLWPNKTQANSVRHSNAIDFQTVAKARNSATPLTDSSLENAVDQLSSSDQSSSLHRNGIAGSPSINNTAVLPSQHQVAKLQDATATSALQSLELAESLVEQCELDSPYWEEFACPLPEVEPAPVELLASREIVHGLARLEDTNRRIRNARLGIAPINGILLWIDTPQVADCLRLARPLGQSIRRDLVLIQQQLGAIVPITCVFDRMHEIAGFPELIRRLGPDRVAKAHLGEALEIDQVLDPVAIDQACQWATSAIQRSIFQTLRTERGLVRPGTRKLFQLLLASRGRVMESIRILAVDAFGFDSRLKPDTDPFCLSGIFFCGSGTGDTHHGFIKQIFQRMMDQQDLLSPTSTQTRVDQTLNRVVFLLQLFCLLLSLGLVVQVLRWAF